LEMIDFRFKKYPEIPIFGWRFVLEWSVFG